MDKIGHVAAAPGPLASPSRDALPPRACPSRDVLPPIACPSRSVRPLYHVLAAALGPEIVLA